jgi:hypothetical protein
MRGRNDQVLGDANPTRTAQIRRDPASEVVHVSRAEIFADSTELAEVLPRRRYAVTPTRRYESAPGSSILAPGSFP